MQRRALWWSCQICKLATKSINTVERPANPSTSLADDALVSTMTLGDVNSDLTIIARIKLMGTEAVKAFMTDMWLARHTPETVLPILLSIFDSIKNEFADAVAYGGGVYAVGYCFGGKYVSILAGDHPTTDSREQSGASADEEKGTIRRGPLIKAGAFAHGTLVTKEDLEAVKVPLCIVAVENDSLFPEAVRDAGERYLKSSGIAHEISVYPGVPHGFARVGNYEDEKIRDAQGRAFRQMVDWLQAH